jgi:hypothetical protein
MRFGVTLLALAALTGAPAHADDAIPPVRFTWVGTTGQVAKSGAGVRTRWAWVPSTDKGAPAAGVPVLRHEIETRLPDRWVYQGSTGENARVVELRKGAPGKPSLATIEQTGWPGRLELEFKDGRRRGGSRS